MEAFIVICIILSLFFILMAITAPGRQRKRQEEAARLAAQREYEQKKKEEEKARAEQAFKKQEATLFEKYGNDCRKLKTSWYSYTDTSKYIYVFPTSKVLIIDNKEFFFDNILRFELTDDATTKTTTTGGQVKTDFNPWSAAGKADAARMLTGSRAAGYAAAQSATKTTVTPTKTTTETIHKYNVILYLKDILNPLYTVKFGTQGDYAREFVGVLEAIKALQN